MNILIFSSALVGLSTRTRGGPSIWCENFINFLRDNGHHVIGLSIGRLTSARKIPPPFKEILYDSSNPLSRLWRLDPILFGKMPESFFAARKATKLCEKHKIDVIVGTGVHECSGFYLVDLPAPLVISIRGEYTKEIPIWLSGDPNFNRHKKMYDAMEFMALQSSSCVTFVSNWLKSRLSSRPLPNKHLVVPNPLRTYRAASDTELEKSLKLPHDKKIIITITSFHSLHRLDGFKIFAKASHIINANTPDVHFLVLGGGQDQKYFNDVKELTAGLPITFAGYREDVIQILQKGDIYLHCSVLETFSNAIIEAMSVGLPCVSTETGGIPEIVAHGVNGMLADLDPESVARTVLELLRNPGLTETLGEAARKSVQENYVWPVLGPRWENILREITQE